MIENNETSESKIIAWLDANKPSFVTCSDIASSVLDVEKANKIISNQIVAVLKGKGWIPWNRRINGKQTKGYVMETSNKMSNTSGETSNKMSNRETVTTVTPTVTTVTERTVAEHDSVVFATPKTETEGTKECVNCKSFPNHHCSHFKCYMDPRLEPGCLGKYFISNGKTPSLERID